jgi:hypothetical protein
VGLVEALQHGRQQPLRPTEDAGSSADVPGVDPADLGDPLGRVLRDTFSQLPETHCVRVDVVPVDPTVGDDLVQQSVRHRDVGARQWSQIHPAAVPGGTGDLRVPGVDAHDARRIRPGQPVQHPHPQHRLGLGIRIHSTGWVSATLWPNSAMTSA